MIRTKPPLGSSMDWSHPLSNGVVGRWLMNENAGNIIIDITGNNHCTLYNDVTWKKHHAGEIVLNGTNQYAQKTSPKGLAIEKFSIVAWIYPTSFPFYQRIFYIGGTSSLVQRISLITNPNGNLCYVVNNGDQWQWLSAQALSINTWQMVAITYSCQTTLYYIDGKLDANSYTDTAVPSHSADYLIIGYLPATGGQWFAGSISQIIVYNRALSKDEIASLYSNPYHGILRRRQNLMIAVSASTSSIKTFNGLSRTSTKTINALNLSSIKTMNGLA